MDTLLFTSHTTIASGLLSSVLSVNVISDSLGLFVCHNNKLYLLFNVYNWLYGGDSAILVFTGIHLKAHLQLSAVICCFKNIFESYYISLTLIFSMSYTM